MHGYVGVGVGFLLNFFFSRHSVEKGILFSVMEGFGSLFLILFPRPFSTDGASGRTESYEYPLISCLYNSALP